MHVTQNISYFNVDSTKDIEGIVIEKISKLEKICDYMTCCKVLIEKKHNSSQGTNPYLLHIDVSVPPGHRIVVKRTYTEGERNDSFPTMLRQAFDNMQRYLEELLQLKMAVG